MDLRLPSMLRFACAALLMLAATLAVGGDALRHAAPQDVSIRIADVVVPICHGGPRDAGDAGAPAGPVDHDCCAFCALAAPALLPAPPVLFRAARIAVFVAAWSATSAALPARPRTPRQSQGPPRA